MTEETGQSKLLCSQADFLEKEITRLEVENSDSPVLPFLRARLNTLRRQERPGQPVQVGPIT